MSFKNLSLTNSGAISTFITFNIALGSLLNAAEYKFILFNKIGKIGVIRLNHPPINALGDEIMKDLDLALKNYNEDPELHCMILMGSKKHFSGGANIKEMQHKNYMDVYKNDFLSKGWETMSTLRKPIFAAVLGHALGGGCELAQRCNFIIAGDGAKFSQPEVTIGTIPGAGGTQFLPRSVGKGNAMYYCLTGRMMNAEKAQQIGLVSLVVPDDRLEEEALKIANEIASYSLPSVMKITEAIHQAYETPLSAGLKIERNLFHSTFTHRDQKEGMQAFAQKRPPVFNNE